MMYVDRFTMIELQNLLLRKDATVHWQTVRMYCQFIQLSPLPFSLDGLSDNGSITIRDTCRHGGPNGTLHTLSGLAYRPNPSEQGRLMVKLDGIDALNCTLQEAIIFTMGNSPYAIT